MAKEMKGKCEEVAGMEDAHTFGKFGKRGKKRGGKRKGRRKGGR